MEETKKMLKPEKENKNEDLKIILRDLNQDVKNIGYIYGRKIA